jgi:hypothetical protein
MIPCLRSLSIGLAALACALVFWFALSFAADTTTAFAIGETGLDKLHWGMSQSEIEVTYPDVRVWEGRKPTTLKLSNIVLAQCEFEVQLVFFGNGAGKLQRITLYYVGSQLAECHSRVTSYCALAAPQRMLIVWLPSPGSRRRSATEE